MPSNVIYNLSSNCAFQGCDYAKFINTNTSGIKVCFIPSTSARLIETLGHGRLIKVGRGITEKSILYSTPQQLEPLIKSDSELPFGLDQINFLRSSILPIPDDAPAWLKPYFSAFNWGFISSIPDTVWNQTSPEAAQEFFIDSLGVVAAATLAAYLVTFTIGGAAIGGGSATAIARWAPPVAVSGNIIINRFKTIQQWGVTAESNFNYWLTRARDLQRQSTNAPGSLDQSYQEVSIQLAKAIESYNQAYPRPLGWETSPDSGITAYIPDSTRYLGMTADQVIKSLATHIIPENLTPDETAFIQNHAIDIQHFLNVELPADIAANPGNYPEVPTEFQTSMFTIPDYDNAFLTSVHDALESIGGGVQPPVSATTPNIGPYTKSAVDTAATVSGAMGQTWTDMKGADSITLGKVVTAINTAIVDRDLKELADSGKDLWLWITKCF